ncbi:MAG TPA: DoxX family protein [Myxococcales bacterium]|jgi:putative oxidoreductase
MRGLFPFVARLMIAAIFVQGALGKIMGWNGQASYMRGHGLHFIPLLLGVALAIEALGTICLVVGFQTRIAAAIMCLYLLAVSVLLHDFWAAQNAGMQQTHFLKNLAICGGLLMVAVFGGGEWSLDSRRRRI